MIEKINGNCLTFVEILPREPYRVVFILLKYTYKFEIIAIYIVLLMLCLSPNEGDLKDIVVNNSYHIWNTKTGQHRNYQM